MSEHVSFTTEHFQLIMNASDINYDLLNEILSTLKKKEYSYTAKYDPNKKEQHYHSTDVLSHHSCIVNHLPSSMYLLPHKQKDMLYLTFLCC